MIGYCIKTKKGCCFSLQEVLSEADCYYCKLRKLGYEPSAGRNSSCIYWQKSNTKFLKLLKKERMK